MKNPTDLVLAIITRGRVMMATDCPKSEIETFFDTVSRHGYGASAGKLIVPGLPEAETMSRRLGAVLEFLKWLGSCSLKRFPGIVLKGTGD